MNLKQLCLRFKEAQTLKYEKTIKRSKRPIQPKPMDLENTIRWAILEYPSICPNRGKVLHHMFFVIGNGYSWVNGQLLQVKLHPKDTQTFLDAVYDLEEHLPPRKFRERVEVFDYLDIKRIRGYCDARDQIHDRMKNGNFNYHGQEHYRPYPVCPDHAAFWCVPVEVHKDYLMGAIEAGKGYLKQKTSSEVIKQLSHLKQMLADRL